MALYAWLRSERMGEKFVARALIGSDPAMSWRAIADNVFSWMASPKDMLREAEEKRGHGE